MTAKDIISPQIIPISAVSGRNDGPYSESKAVKASAPLSLVLEHMASGAEVVPVVDDDTGERLGAVDSMSMLVALSSLFPQLKEYSELMVTCPPSMYSASAIAHAVEDADAHLLNLNVVGGTEPDSPTTILIRVNHSRGESVARSLARYGYDTLSMTGTPGAFNADMVDRVNALLHYLEV